MDKIVNLAEGEKQYKKEIVWWKVAAFIYLHISAAYGLFLILTGDVQLYTILFEYFLGVAAGLGITAGAHRLWAHKAYKATWELRLLLALFQALAHQENIYKWVLDHRTHHKFTDTDADPYNSKRGFFFSHIGWLMVKKHPDVKIKGKTIDMTDLKADKVVMWQKKYYWEVMPLISFILPTLVPVYFWNEDPWTSWYICIWRYVTTLNITWLVNSAAHIWGSKPYDKTISPTENKAVGILAFGEGWHNYHHVFPYDYKAAELGKYDVNVTAAFIDFMAKIGWAYDLRTVQLEIMQKRAERTGDGTLKSSKDPQHHMNTVWKWYESFDGNCENEH